MSANLSFSQTIPQQQSTGIEQGRPGRPVHRRSPMAGTYEKSILDDRESFVNTLQQITKEQNPAKKTSGIGSEKPSQSSVRYSVDPESADQSDLNPHSADGHEDRVTRTEIMPQKGSDNAAIENTPALAFLTIVKDPEELGLVDSAGGVNSPHRAEADLSIVEGSEALKMLIARMGENDLEQSAELKNVLERLRQLIVNTEANMTSSYNNETFPDGLSGNQMAVLKNLEQLMKEIIPGEEVLKESSGETHKRADHSNENASEDIAKVARILAELTDNFRASGAASAIENAGKITNSETGDGTGAIRLTAENRQDAVENIANAKIPASTEGIRADVSGLEDGSDGSAKNRTAVHDSILNPISKTADSGNRFDGKPAENHLSGNVSSQSLKLTEDTQSLKAFNHALRHASQPVHENMANDDSLPDSKTANDGQPAKALFTGQRYVGENAQENPLNNESSPVSKMINDAQLAKENQTKMEAAQSDDFGLKVARIDTGANDSGLLNSQNQTAEKSFEATGFTRQTEVGHDNLRTHTLDQIVKRAVIYMKSGQHEARIDLKPDFLGHVRMQVTTENHQVTVKILTEFPVVKDMIENNIQQLKSDLQQQGLNVDKLEVSVSNDSDKYQNSRREAAMAKDRLRNIGLKNPEIETGKSSGSSSLKTAGESVVDYFA